MLLPGFSLQPLNDGLARIAGWGIAEYPFNRSIQCDVAACLAPIQRDLDECLSACPPADDISKLQARAFCVNSCVLYARQNEDACTRTGCSIWDTCCGNKCAHTFTDVQNCGECSKVCTGQNPACCSGICKDLQTDSQSCGQCWNRCTGGKVCTQGFCICPAETPWDCNGVCTDQTTDSNHCGGCGIKCNSNQQCCNGTCTPIDTTQSCGDCTTRCASGQGCCSTTTGFTCVDIQAEDVDNCGACGHHCPGSEKCCSGNCHDLSTENGNCGVCGGICQSGLSCCQGKCMSFNTTSNCGTCGNSHACPSGASCSNGACACPPGMGGVCNNKCTDLTKSPNCGGCGISCPPGFLCSNGACICQSGVKCPFGTPHCCPTQDQCTNNSCCQTGFGGCLGGNCCRLPDFTIGFIGDSCCDFHPTGCCQPCTDINGNQYQATCWSRDTPCLC
jgi:hypothetical protein